MCGSLNLYHPLFNVIAANVIYNLHVQGSAGSSLVNAIESRAQDNGTKQPVLEEDAIYEQKRISRSFLLE